MLLKYRHFMRLKKRNLKNCAGKYSQPPGSAGPRAAGSILVDSTHPGLKIFGKNYVYPKSSEALSYCYLQGGAVFAPLLMFDIIRRDA